MSSSAGIITKSPSCDDSVRRLVVAVVLATSLVVIPESSRATPTLPVIPSTVFNITNYGAVGNSVYTNTAAIQNAINAASTAGGGIVEIPPAGGSYLCGPITLKSKINLKIDGGAILQLLPIDKYPGGNVSPAHFISGSGLTDIAITGSGAIDGQGAPWWYSLETNSAIARPRMIALAGCVRELIEDVTLSNAPMFHIAISAKSGSTLTRDTTVQRVIIRAPASGTGGSHNTDACDVTGTNTLVQNCNISVGDDNYTCGGNTSDVLITNNTYGSGHGVSIGSYTSPYVSNITVINCTFNNTDNGIRVKTDRDRGGVVQNLRYYNLKMTNLTYPVLIYAYYTNTLYGPVNNLTPAIAAQDPGQPIISTTPVYRNIFISNVTATAQSGRICGLIWGVPEMPVSNAVLTKVSITGSKPFGIYHARAVTLADCQFTVPSSITNLAFCDVDLTITNSAPSASLMKIDGVTTGAYSNKLSLYNTLATLKNTNALGTSPALTLGGVSTFIISNSFAPDSAASFKFILGTNGPTKVQVVNNLTLGGTLNVYAGNGFTNGTYTLFTSGGALATNNLSLGAAPAGYNYSISTNIGGQVNLIVSPIITDVAPSISGPANLTVLAGQDANFTVAVLAGSPLPALQWWTNGVNVAGQTGSSFTLSNASYALNGSVVSVVATNVAGVVTNSAMLAVVNPPQIAGYNWLPGDNRSLEFSGPTGLTYRLWAGTDLVFPVTNNWQVLTSGVFDLAPIVIPLDMTNYPQRYYQITVP